MMTDKNTENSSSSAHGSSENGLDNGLETEHVYKDKQQLAQQAPCFLVDPARKVNATQKTLNQMLNRLELIPTLFWNMLKYTEI